MEGTLCREHGGHNVQGGEGTRRELSRGNTEEIHCEGT
jgi:hypothetical protein